MEIEEDGQKERSGIQRKVEMRRRIVKEGRGGKEILQNPHLPV